MLKILMAAPVDANGRYKGGICALVNRMLEEKKLIADNGMEIIPFNTCRVQRSNEGENGINLKNLKNFYSCYKDSSAEIKKNRPDVFYYHSSVRLALLKDLLILDRAKRKFGIKTVVHIHNGEANGILTGKKLIDSLILKLLAKCDKTVFLSERVKNEFLRLGLPEDKCKVIYNFSTLSYTEAEIKEKDYKNRLLFVGAITERKGIFDLMEVLLSTDKDYSLTVCGGFVDNSEKPRFDEYLKKMGDRVNYLGYVANEEKRRVFLETDVLVLPSYTEGLPVVILEAFSAGSAVISTEVGAIPEIILGDNGHVIKVRDNEALKRILEDTYLNGKNEETEKRKLGNYKYSENFTTAHFISQTAALCRDCIK